MTEQTDPVREMRDTAADLKRAAARLEALVEQLERAAARAAAAEKERESKP